MPFSGRRVKKKELNSSAVFGTCVLGGQIQADMETQRDNQRQWVERFKWKFRKRRNM